MIFWLYHHLLLTSRLYHHLLLTSILNEFETIVYILFLIRADFAGLIFFVFLLQWVVIYLSLVRHLEYINTVQPGATTNTKERDKSFEYDPHTFIGRPILAYCTVLYCYIVLWSYYFNHNSPPFVIHAHYLSQVLQIFQFAFSKSCNCNASIVWIGIFCNGQHFQ